MRIIDQESTSGKIIYALGTGVGILAALSNQRTSYNFTKDVLKQIFGLSKKPKNINKALFHLRKRKLIQIEKCGKEHKLMLTENGKKVFLRFNYEKIKFNKNKVWDRQFRIILFDIPETKKNARDAFRFKMRELGCVKFNDSVWVYPYQCQKEIDFIASYWGVEKYIQFIIAKDLTNRDKLEKHFKL